MFSEVLPMSPLSTQRRFLLGEAEMPTHYYNISPFIPPRGSQWDPMRSRHSSQWS